MSDETESDELAADHDKPSWWLRLAQGVLPDRVVHRWDRVPEGSQQDAAHYNLRSGL